jgi:16S rRNA (adenine1518-N6/adenine1519-N6)-dimethyltransferase
MAKKILFVNSKDRPISSGTKEEAWNTGAYHRIVKIFLFNPNGETLIQKRSMDCVSNPGRWDHSAAGHVDEGETYKQAALRELKEEINLTSIPLKEVMNIETHETDEPDKIKNRFNMLYEAHYDGDIHPGPEVSETRWITPKNLLQWIEERPDDFTQGFVISFRELVERSQ